MLSVRSDNPNICWCFSCNSLVSTDDEKTSIETDDEKTSIETENSRESRGYVVRGMPNLGNTCFFNSVMQNLLAMRGYLVDINGSFGPLTLALKELFTTSRDCDGDLDPSTLFECICDKAAQFRGFEQQDSHELLRYLLDCLNSEEHMARKSIVCSGASSSGVTVVDAVFGGQLTSSVSCMECGHTSVVNEVFLDLSLPVPLKKPPPRKVPLSRQKRNKLPGREGNRRRKVREKGIVKVVAIVDMDRAESSSSPSECNQSPDRSSEKKQAVVVGADESIIGVDHTSPADSVSQNCVVHVAHSSESGLVYKGGGSVKCTSDVLRPTEQIVTSDSCGASFCRDGNASSCTEDSGVVSVPQTGLESVVDTNKMIASVGSPVNESCAQTASVDGCEQAQVDFVGFGDLFNEPEVTSDFRTGTRIGKEMDITMWAGNSENSQDEVDDTGAPLSLDSCLALFTKSELLSDEHAWHCEFCSENFTDQITERRSGKRQAVAKIDHSEALKPATNEGEVSPNKCFPSLELNLNEATEFKDLGNRNSEDLVMHSEGLPNQNVDVDASRNPLNPINCKYVHDGDTICFDLSNPLLTDKDFYQNVIQKDEDYTESDHNSQFLSCPSAHEASLLQEKSCRNDSDSCSTCDRKSIGCGGQDMTPVLDGLPDQTETVPQSSCENDNFSEVNQEGKGGPKLLDEVQPENDSEGEEMEIESRKVKRDATRRTLIDRAPPILTIHLNRFRQDARGRFNKLRGYISFQEILDLKPYMDPRSEEKDKCCYRLLGLVEHSGTMTRGHYVAYVRGERPRAKAEKGNSPTWFYASDSHVREISLSEVLKSEAYILFYERVSC